MEEKLPINLISYLRLRGDISFRNSSFNELDAGVFALLVGLDLEGLVEEEISFQELYTKYEDAHRKEDDDEWGDSKLELFRLAAEASRYEKVKASNFVRDVNLQEEKTFYAMTYFIPPFDYYIAYRGTDGTLVSWKENFNTIFALPTSGQTEAKNYFEKAIKSPFAKYTLIGHSKGANLACYAAIFCSEKAKKRLKEVYAFDAPGFAQDISENAEYLAVKDKIKAYIPEESVIGRLMNPPYTPIVVESNAKGIYQHDMYSWQLGRESFNRKSGTNQYSDNLSKKVNDWIFGMDIAERPAIVRELFDVFQKNGIDHVNKLLKMDAKSLLGVIYSLTMLSAENRQLLIIIVKELKNIR